MWHLLSEFVAGLVFAASYALLIEMTFGRTGKEWADIMCRNRDDLANPGDTTDLVQRINNMVADGRLPYSDRMMQRFEISVAIATLAAVYLAFTVPYFGPLCVAAHAVFVVLMWRRLPT